MKRPLFAFDRALKCQLAELEQSRYQDYFTEL